MILVTGATGFLGHSLMPRLVVRGEPVRALVRQSSDSEWLHKLGVETVIGDITDRTSVLKAAEGVRAIVHAAARFRFWGSADEFEQTNVTGTSHILEAAVRAKVERFVHVSTVVVVGKPANADPIDEETLCEPVDTYQHTKHYAERLVRLYHEQTRLPVIILRPGAFYGPGGRYAWNRLFFEDPFRGLRVQVHNGRRLTFPVYIHDVATAILLALDHGYPGETYNICGDPVTHNQANQVISATAGISAWRLNIPIGLMLTTAKVLTAIGQRTGHEPFYPTTLQHYVFPDWNVSSAKARNDLHFIPTPLAEGVAATVEWYREIGLLKTRPR